MSRPLTSPLRRNMLLPLTRHRITNNPGTCNNHFEIAFSSSWLVFRTGRYPSRFSSWFVRLAGVFGVHASRLHAAFHLSTRLSMPSRIDTLRSAFPLSLDRTDRSEHAFIQAL